MKFWSVDVPGQDPVVLLWAWWVSLVLSCSLSFASLPVGIPVQSSVLSANNTITNLFVPVMAGDCGDEIPSNIQTATSRHHFICESRESSNFSLICTLSSILSTKQYIFVLFSASFANVLQICQSVNVFLQFFSVSVPELLLNFSPNHDVPYIFRESRKDSLHSLMSLCVF